MKRTLYNLSESAVSGAPRPKKKKSYSKQKTSRWRRGVGDGGDGIRILKDGRCVLGDADDEFVPTEPTSDLAPVYVPTSSFKPVIGPALPPSMRMKDSVSVSVAPVALSSSVKWGPFGSLSASSSSPLALPRPARLPVASVFSGARSDPPSFSAKRVADLSPPCKPVSDQSPPRKPVSDLSPPRGHAADLSPPRKLAVAAPVSAPKKPESSVVKNGLLTAEEYAKQQEEKARVAREGMEGVHPDRPEDTVYRENGRILPQSDIYKRQLARQGVQSEEEKSREYVAWNAGKAQLEGARQKAEEFEKIRKSKFAIHEDDVALNEALKSKVLADDPLPNRQDSSMPAVQGYPPYRGPPAPPNRFGILPGYRWDGKDRGNGYERRLIEKLKQREADAEWAHKIRTRDM